MTDDNNNNNKNPLVRTRLSIRKDILKKLKVLAVNRPYPNTHLPENPLVKPIQTIYTTTPSTTDIGAMFKPRQCQADLLLKFVKEGLDRLPYDEADWFGRGNRRDIWYSAKKTKFEVKSETRTLAQDICKRLRGDLYMNGKNPKTLASGVIRYSLLATGQALKRTESGRSDAGRKLKNSDIPEALGISKDSVTIAYKDLKRYIDSPSLSNL